MLVRPPVRRDDELGPVRVVDFDAATGRRLDDAATDRGLGGGTTGRGLIYLAAGPEIDPAGRECGQNAIHAEL